MKFSRNLPFHTRRDAWVEVDLGAIEQNATNLRNLLPDSLEMMAVLKADAYGHGAVMVAPTLEACGIRMIGVAAMDEALQLREAGITLPILVLGVTPDWAMHYAVENDVQLTIFSDLHLESLQRLYEVTGQSAQVQIKVDTGMHRIGVDWQAAADFTARCQSRPSVTVTGIFSHLSHTGDDTFSRLQAERWDKVLAGLAQPPRWVHLANSAGSMHYPAAGCNMVRAGIALFGYPGDDKPLPIPLKPAIGLKARIVHLHELPPGEGISYNRMYINDTGHPRRIATLPLGYADGVPRGLSNKISALYGGRRIPQVGVITMDQMMVDVTGIPDARVGDVITLLGNTREAAIRLTEWAQHLGTIEYELMCGLRVRLPKTYIR